MKLLTADWTKRYADRIRELHPQTERLSDEDFKRIFLRAFGHFKEGMEMGIVPRIMMNYLGSFKISPRVAKGYLNNYLRSGENGSVGQPGAMTKERFIKDTKLMLDVIEIYGTKSNKVSLDYYKGRVQKCIDSFNLND